MDQATQDEFIAQVKAMADTVRNGNDPLAQAEAARDLQKIFQEYGIVRLRGYRTQGARTAHAQGWSMKEIADALGVSTARVEQIINE